MKRFLLLLITVLTNVYVFGQAKEAIKHDADTMQKYLPEKKLSENVAIRHITIEGNKVTKRAVILREMSVREGDTVAVDSLPLILNQNKLRLVNMALFNDIDMQIEKVNKNEVDWHIRVEERWYIIPSLTIQYADRNFNTWYTQGHHELSRVNTGITIADRNFLGELDTLSTTVQLGYTQGLGLNYQIPYMDKQQKQGIGFTLSYFRSRQTYYATDSDKLKYASSNAGYIQQQIQGGITYIYRPAYKTRHIFELNYKDYLVQDTLLKLNPNYFSNGSNKVRLLELLYRYQLNEVDNWNYPLYGFKIVNYAIVRAGFQGFNFQAFDNIEAGTFRNPLPNWYFSAIFRGRLMYPAKVPYYFQGGLGTSTDYVRGYEYYVIDGSQYGLVRLDLKREIFNKIFKGIPIEYFTSFPLRIYPKIFADLGYINGSFSNNSYLNNRLLYSGGIGVDIVTFYEIKIRIEYTINHLGQNGLYLHFNSE